MFWWRALITLLLAAILALLVWDREEIVSRLPQRTTPHEAYARALAQAGLADTALARDWLAAADRALLEPEAARLPLSAAVTHAASDPRAYGYRLDLQRGRILQVALEIESPDAPRVFIDLFRVTGADEDVRHVASADEDAYSLEQEIRHDGVYIVRIQPELLRGGHIRIAHETRASLTFPVAGRDAAAVGSVFGDPRDGGRRAHHGIDIFAPRDTPVLAAADGVVRSVGTNRLGGNIVWVWDPDRRQSHYYAHLSQQAVRTGQRVQAGDIVGYVGNTGNARGTPPHLHFAIYAAGDGPIDPLPFVHGARGPQPPVPGSRSSDAGVKPEQDTTGMGG
jgi:peptidoglycan LD-endopeptidase LytH